MIRLTIRATDESVPPVLLKLMEERISMGMSTTPESREGPSHKEISDTFGSIMVT